MAIKEQEFQVFINSVKHYFKQTCGVAPDFQPPFILDKPMSLCEYIGAIRVSGSYSGTVYFTANADLLNDLLQRLGEPSLDRETLSDAIGEVANTIAGNFRRDYGSQFVISTPKVRSQAGATFRPQDDSTTYVVPLTFNQRSANLMVDLSTERRR